VFFSQAISKRFKLGTVLLRRLGRIVVGFPLLSIGIRLGLFQSRLESCNFCVGRILGACSVGELALVSSELGLGGSELLADLGDLALQSLDLSSMFLLERLESLLVNRITRTLLFGLTCANLLGKLADFLFGGSNL